MSRRIDSSPIIVVVWRVDLHRFQGWPAWYLVEGITIDGIVWQERSKGIAVNDVAIICQVDRFSLRNGLVNSFNGTG